MNGAELITKHHVIMRINNPCSKDQDQRDVTVMNGNICKKYAAPILWLPYM